MRTRNAMQLKAFIRNRAQEIGVTPQLMMQNYLLERLLERISLSHWKENIVIKGGVLISSLIGAEKRTTHDLDTTVRGFPLTHENAEKAFREIIEVDADDDFTLTSYVSKIFAKPMTTRVFAYTFWRSMRRSLLPSQ